MTTLFGACSCREVKLAVRGAPSRIGVGNCTDCGQEIGSAFTFLAVWPASDFETGGDTSTFRERSFCPKCSLRPFSFNGHKAEIKLEILSEAPTPLTPTYELWVKRRER